MKIGFSRQNVLSLKKKCAAKVMSRGASVRSPCFLTKMWQSWPRACPLWACEVQRSGDFCDSFKRIQTAHPQSILCIFVEVLATSDTFYAWLLVWRHESARVTASRHNAWPGRLFSHSWPRAKSASRSRQKIGEVRIQSSFCVSEVYVWTPCHKMSEWNSFNKVAFRNSIERFREGKT